MSAPHLLVLAVDGLRASPLGAYGGSTTTPEIDRLASQAKLYDWHFANAPQIERVYADLWNGGQVSLAQFLTQGGYQSALVADDRLMLANPSATTFDVVGEVETGHIEKPAETAATTWFANSCEQLAAAVAATTAKRTDNRPQFLWLHTRGLHGPWDAPSASIQALLDEDEIELVTSLAPATGRVTAEEPDAPFIAACRYAAQLQVVDACVGNLLAYIDEAFQGEPLTFILLGTRGYALGEHGVIGEDDRLYQETLHTPLLVRQADGSTAFTRVANPVGPASLLASLSATDEGPSQDLRQQSDSGAMAIQHQQWRLIRPAASNGEQPSPELYLKPDDRWEANNVASRAADVVQRLEALLSPGETI